MPECQTSSSMETKEVPCGRHRTSRSVIGTLEQLPVYPSFHCCLFHSCNYATHETRSLTHFPIRFGGQIMGTLSYLT